MELGIKSEPDSAVIIKWADVGKSFPHRFGIVAGRLPPGTDLFSTESACRVFSTVLRAIQQHNAESNDKIESVAMLADHVIFNPKGDIDEQSKAIHDTYTREIMPRWPM